MTSVGLSPDNRKKCGIILWGMRQRLAVSPSDWKDPAILLLDEPLNGLDYEGVKRFTTSSRCKRRGKIILVASHHEEDIRLLCDGYGNSRMAF